MNPILANILLGLSAAVFSFLIGGIPTAVVIGKVFFAKNPLEYGSHNSGGTNAGRVLGKKAGIIVITLDILKTIVVFWSLYAVIEFSGLRKVMPIWNDGRFYAWSSLFFASLGHCFSPYLKGKGGKAVACFYGSVGGTSWLLSPFCFLVFFIVFKITKRIMSKASIWTGAILLLFEGILSVLSILFSSLFDFSFFAWSFGIGKSAAFGYESFIAISLVYLILLLRHADNIRRIHSGEEKPLKWEK